jgi:kinetochore protein Spc25, fungi type
MKIEGVREDVLRIVYTHIYETDWTKECSLTVDLSERNYKGMKLCILHLLPVLDCKPSLPNLEELVGQLNETREFFEFLKWMRQAFKKQSIK